MNNENPEQNEIFDDEMLPEYDFTNSIQVKHDQAYRQEHTVTIYKEDGTTIVQHFDKIVTQRQNIFTINCPVPQRFVGRSKLIETAFDQICNRSHLAVWGGPGMGKSSFLQLLTESQVWQLRGLNPSQAVIILLKCESIQPFNTANFWRNILELLKYQINNIPSLHAEIESLLQKENNTTDDLVKVLRLLGEHDKFLVLLVDDYDLTLFANEQYTEADIKAFVSQCRYLAYSVPERKYLSMIVTSSRRLFEIGPKLAPGHSPWYNHYLFRQLKPFNDGEVEALLTGIPITPALKAGIRKIADGNPFLLQNACYLLYEELREGQIPEKKKFAMEFESVTRHFFQATWELSTETEQLLLMLLALYRLEGKLSQKQYDIQGIENIFSQKEIELKNLEERGVLKSTEEKIAYDFASSIMEWWTINKIKNCNIKELEERKKVFFNLMTHQQAEKAMSGFRWILQNQDKIPSILKWVERLGLGT